MSPSKNDSHNSSNRHGEAVGREAMVLASCYVVDASTVLTGFHYSTTGAGGKLFSFRNMINPEVGQSGIPEVSSGLPSPPSSPPLAALTSANELALTSKNSNRKRDNNDKRNSRKEGAAYTIKEECERLFCGVMKTVFLGDEGRFSNDSYMMGANAHSPPDEAVHVHNNYFDNVKIGQIIDAWMEVWDYTGGCSFRAFVGGEGDQKSLFAFFDSAVIRRDLKQGLMALIELAESVFALQQVVICLDRSLPEADAKAFMKSLRWVGFELVTLEMWAKDKETTSDKWLFLGMEV